MKAIGPTFGAELNAAGLGGLRFGWDATGQFTYDLAITPEQRAAIEAVYTAHNPAKTLPDWAGFEAHLKSTIFPTTTGRRGMAKLYPLFVLAMRSGNAADVEADLIDAHNNLLLTTDQWVALQAAVTQFAIPITLS